MRTIDSDFLHRALQHYYGYAAFRPGQEEIITHILQGEPVLAVLPTGAGKSICFQLPSLLLKGVTLVVSPLISLMKDQAEALSARGIPAAYLDSSMTSSEYGRVLHAALNKQCKFLYVAPERLLNPTFVRFAKAAYITMVAVDEAHCVSQWGHSFRKDYYNIPQFMAQLSPRPLIAAFTATATPEVRRDICHRLEMLSAKIVVSGFDRPNLHFAVERTQDKDRSLLEFLAKHKHQCGVIYCATRQRVEQVNTLLARQGYSALRYHAGLTPEERRSGAITKTCSSAAACPLLLQRTPLAWASTRRMCALWCIIICPRIWKAITRRRGAPDAMACPRSAFCSTTSRILP